MKVKQCPARADFVRSRAVPLQFSVPTIASDRAGFHQPGPIPPRSAVPRVCAPASHRHRTRCLRTQDPEFTGFNNPAASCRTPRTGKLTHEPVNTQAAPAPWFNNPCCRCTPDRLWPRPVQAWPPASPGTRAIGFPSTTGTGSARTHLDADSCPIPYTDNCSRHRNTGTFPQSHNGKGTSAVKRARGTRHRIRHRGKTGRRGYDPSCRADQ